MAKLYRVLVEEIDPQKGGDPVVQLDETYTGFSLLGDCIEDENGNVRLNEVIMHDNIMNIAHKIAASKKFSMAAKMATIFAKFRGEVESDIAETEVMSDLMGMFGGVLGEGQEGDDDD